MTELDGVQVPVNEYFLDHPETVLGETARRPAAPTAPTT